MKLKKITKTAAKLSRLISGLSKEKTEMLCGAIITAAGSSTRMGRSKQLIDLCGKPAISYSICAFQNSKYCKEIIVVAKKDEINTVKEIVQSLDIVKTVKIVEGGKERQDSVKNGFFALSDDIKYVAIHDGARPMIRSECIDSLYETAFKNGSACAATKITDSVKRAKDGNISEAVSRDDLYTVQTPQVFFSDIYRCALALRNKSDKVYTDDCGSVSAAGFKIPLVDIGKTNIKLTTPEDIYIAETLLEKGE